MSLLKTLKVPNEFTREMQHFVALISTLSELLSSQQEQMPCSRATSFSPFECVDFGEEVFAFPWINYWPFIYKASSN